MQENWWARQDLNLGPTDYESAALTAELQALRFTTYYSEEIERKREGLRRGLPVTCKGILPIQ